MRGSQHITVPPQPVWFVGAVDGRTVRAVKKCTPFQLECLPWGIHLKRRIRHKRTALCTKVFIAALSVVVKNTEPNKK